MPRPLASFLVDHTVFRSAKMGWSELRKGDLLQAAEAQRVEVMVSADQNLAYQQNLTGRRVALVVLLSGRLPKVRERLNEVICAVDEALPWKLHSA